MRLCLRPGNGRSLRDLTAQIRAALRREARAAGYRVYVTDTLRCIAQNTAHAFGGRAPAFRWADVCSAAPGKLPDAMQLARERLRRAEIEVREYGSV